MASELLRELAPLLAEEGIDVDNIDVPDVDTLRQAMNRAIERQNMVRFTTEWCSWRACPPGTQPVWPCPPACSLSQILDGPGYFN